MPIVVTTGRVRSVIRGIAKVIEEQKQYLSDLDRAIGDGDHGFNMARGFGVAVRKLDDAPVADIGELFKIVAMALISNVGGAAGPLYGSMFLKASSSAKGLTEVDLPNFAKLFKEGVLGVQARGNAELGDKTMVDVLLPVAESLEKNCAAGLSYDDVFVNAERVAADCMENTRDIVARKGRASYLGERSVGHIDPGAASSYLMVRAIGAALSKKELPNIVSLLLLSHSPKIAEGVKDFALQMTGETNIVAIGGTNTGTFGTDFDGTFAAMSEAAAKGEVIVLSDIGSARVTGQMAKEMLKGKLRKRVFLCDAALVEGSLVAAIAIAAGYSVEETLEQLKQFLLPKGK